MRKNSNKTAHSQAPAGASIPAGASGAATPAAGGIDLGSKHSEICLVDAAGEVVLRRRVATTAEAFEQALSGLPTLPLAIETGGETNWVRRQLTALGHQVTVANAKRLKVLTDTHSKDDRRDARLLAEIQLRWPRLLQPVQPRSLESERHRALLKLRQSVVETRVKLLNSARGVLKSFGIKPPRASAEAYVRKVRPLVPDELRPALEPLLDAIEAVGVQIRRYDRTVVELCEERYWRSTRRMRSIKGVGPLTALAFTLELDDEVGRLESSRAAGALVGLRPKRRDSGESEPDLAITKAGNRMLRTLLIQCAQYLLGRGDDSALRRWGLGLAERSGTKRGKRRAVVATARKLAVLLHTLWRRDEDFEPWPQGEPAGAAASAATVSAAASV